MEAGPQRIVSLVPSWTEALFALGLGERVVGVTEWCVHPADAVAALPKVGGTKSARADAVLALGPDLVIANQEENRRRTVERLRAAGVRVWVTYPRTVREGAEALQELLALGAPEWAEREVVAPVLAALEEAERAEAERAAGGRPRARVFCPVWRDPWMAVGPDTYADDLLALCGGANVFAERSERRYPLVTLEEVVAARPHVILLPDEPYAFGPRDAEELTRLDVPAAHDGRVSVIDGTWLSWYGPRIRYALPRLRALLSSPGAAER